MNIVMESIHNDGNEVFTWMQRANCIRSDDVARCRLSFSCGLLVVCGGL